VYGKVTITGDVLSSIVIMCVTMSIGSALSLYTLECPRKYGVECIHDFVCGVYEYCTM